MNYPAPKTISLLLAALLTNTHVLADDELHALGFIENEDLTSFAVVKPTATELAYSWHIGAIKASVPWSLGADGAKIRIAVIDTGVFNHSELSDRLLAGYNYVANKSIAAGSNSDDNGHGSHVAGIIGGSAGTGYSVGVAPASQIVPIKVLDQNGSGTLANLAKGLDYSRSKNANAFIVNLSLGWDGSSSSTITTALKNNVKAGQLIVAAAGNSGYDNPHWPARYATESWANGQILAVGAVDQNNVIASWSNRAGDSMDYYLVAPGVSIVSTYNQTGTYAYLSGTSMAAPVVSGAAALIKSYWPYLSANKVAGVLLTTATDLGDPGTDRIYGRGLLNLERAMQPVGSTTVSTVSSSSISFGGGSAANTSSAAYGSALGHANLTVAGLDDFGRDYLLDMSALYASPSAPSLNLSQLFSGMDTRMRTTESSVDGARLTMTQIEAPEHYGLAVSPLAQPVALTSMTYAKTLASGEQLSFGMNANPNYVLGFAHTPFESTGFMADKAFANPYLGFNGYQNFAGYGMPLNNHWSVSAGAVSSFDPLAMQGENAIALTGQEYNKLNTSTQTGLLELSGRWKDSKVAVSMGLANEEESLLGGSPGTYFGINDATKTWFMSISAAKQLTADTWLAGSFSYGNSSSGRQSNSLVTSVDSVNSQSWSLGLMTSNLLRKEDRFGIAVSQPMAVNSGKLDMTVPSGMSEEGIMQYENRSVSLAPKDLEYDFELNYYTPISSSSSLSIAGMYRMNPGHDSNTEDQKILALRWQKFF